MDIKANFFKQPDNLNFYSTGGFGGGMIKTNFKINPQKLPCTIDIGFTMKTKGFVIEEQSLDKGFFFTFGLGFRNIIKKD